ncbi:MAG: hypothetical protein WCB03_21955 [Rouxiella badensis]|uniref:hypothetical protein n=1 Tax=Rouxiella badensis TaxID=1646377 RepID=UPI003C3A5C67
MSTPFYAAANKVLNMYERRQLVASVKAPAHSESEIYWATEMLLDLARAAAYAASKEAIALRTAADLWNKSKAMPRPFLETTDEA